MFFKKRAFTLIEVIISMSLLTLVITFLFGYFTKISKIEMDIENVKKIVYEKSNFHLRLMNICSQLSSKDKENFFAKFEKNFKTANLFFNFDNGIDPDPNYSDIIKAKIYVDKNSNLILEMFSKDTKTKQTRKEIIYTNVTSIEYKFLSYSDIQMTPYLVEQVTDNLCWYNFWPETKKNIPTTFLIKINKKHDFVFFLPTKDLL